MEIVKAFNNVVDIVKGSARGIKKLIRKGKINNINSSVNNHNADNINDIVRGIEEKREERKDI